MAGLRGAIGLILIAGATAPAAPVPTVPNPPDDELPVPVARLLRHGEVRAELRLSAGQRAAIDGGLADLAGRHEQKAAVLRGRPDRPAGAFEQLAREKAAGVDTFFRHAAARLLTPVQRARLRQLDWQVRGPAAFADPRVGHALRLTPGQKKAAADLLDQLRDRAERYVDKLGNDDADNLKEELLRFRLEAAKRLETALTPGQRDAWRAMRGGPPGGLDPVQLWFAGIEDGALFP